ncbi:hypothetical protein PN498_13600 [Oscillatoria sp. CS-180]|uniref:hypothetical protein n=1 Tax=Oscillatoria sp. CS-180 TaxID=3021720 RepID=UPI0023313538|nr:hypothetical protein [Oscillatoria sp. CS-180]MDB9527030.1 hypothetical protein [Oscillatoria sp. CS-180]
MRLSEVLVVPAFLGLLAGVAHGVITHQAGLPIGFVEQIHQIVEGESISLK